VCVVNCPHPAWFGARPSSNLKLYPATLLLKPNLAIIEGASHRTALSQLIAPRDSTQSPCHPAPLPQTITTSPPSLPRPCPRSSSSSSLRARGQPSSATLPSNRHYSRLCGKHWMLLYRLASSAMALGGQNGRVTVASGRSPWPLLPRDPPLSYCRTT
jgi:hypothetical protein